MRLNNKVIYTSSHEIVCITIALVTTFKPYISAIRPTWTVKTSSVRPVSQHKSLNVAVSNCFNVVPALFTTQFESITICHINVIKIKS